MLLFNNCLNKCDTENVFNGPFYQPRLKIKRDDYNIVRPNSIITELSMFTKEISYCSVAG